MVEHTHGFHSHPARYVGRIGALAVALGVGGAVFGFTGVAAADGDAPDTTGSGATSAGDTGRATANRSADRRSAPAGQPGAAATTSRGDGAGDRVATQETGPGDRRATAEGQTSRGRDAVSLPAETPDIRVFDIGSRVLPALPTTVTANAPAVAGGSASPAIPAEPIAAEALTPQASSAVATAATAPDVAAGGGDPLTLLGGGDGDAPLVAPLAWATLAAARREEVSGPTPEVLPADAVATEELLGSSISSLSAQKGAVGSTLTIKGDALKGTLQVKFGCSSSDCGWGVVAPIIGEPQLGQVMVTVPVGAPSGYIQLSGLNTANSFPWTATSAKQFTVDGLLPTITGFTPAGGNIGAGGPTVTITGTNFTDAVFVQFGSGQQTSLQINEDGTAITVAIPDGATTGPIVVGLETGGTVSPPGLGQFTVPVQAFPALSGCSGLLCLAVKEARVIGVNALSTVFGQAFPSSGPVGTCTAAGCPLPFGQTTPSVANTVGIYAFNIVYSLTGGGTSDEQIGSAVTALATQPNVLNFISQTVASSPALATLPPAVANTIGDAVKTFVQTSFGSPTVAKALAPFLRDLNLPTGAGLLEFAQGLVKDPLAAFLSRFNSTQWPKAQADLQNKFFGSGAVQTQLGASFTAAVNVLVSSPAVSGYLGQVAASALLGGPVEASNPLAVTIGGAVGTLFSSIGGTVATDAGKAFATFLAQPLLGTTPPVATTLANAVVNAVVGALGVSILPYSVQLPAQLAPAANVAVTQFVTLLLAPTSGGVPSPVVPALGTFAGQVAVAALGDPQVVAYQVTNLLGDGPLAQAVGQEAGAAVATLVGTPAVSNAVAQLANSVVVGILQANGVANALATTAGGLASAVLSGVPLNTALAAAQETLLANAQFDAAVGPAVTNGLTTFLGNADVQSGLATAAGSLVTGLIGDPTVQGAISAEVASTVSTLLRGTPLAQAIGQRVGAAAVVLLTDPDVSAALGQLVTSVVGAVLAADGVSTALADTIGDLTSAVVNGESLESALNAAVIALRSNPAIDAAVGPAVTPAVATFLGNTDLQSAVDAAFASLVPGLINDPTVQGALRTEVTAAVSTALGGGALGQEVGAKVGAAVVTLITDPTVSGALVELVDTVFSDFISSQGVITALSNAAGELATAAVKGTLDTDGPEILAGLRTNPDIDSALQASVGAAVTTFLKNTGVLSAVDTALTSLATELITDPAVQQAVGDRVAGEVNSFLGFGPISVVGEDVGDAVVALLNNPVVSGALVDLVDTVVSDFFSAGGVADAFGAAAGEVALGVLTGESLDAALVEAGRKLQANADVDAAVQASVGAAVAQFLGDTQLWSTVDAGVTALLTQLITDPVVQSALTDRIADEVSTQLGGGDLGEVVGGQVATTVIGLLTDPVIGGALLGVVDTTFSDLFRSPGVIDAFAEAAGDLALAALTLRGQDFDEARAGIINGLRQNPDVDAGVQFAVEDAVADFLNNNYVWSAFDGAAATLVGELLGDEVVQQALSDRIASEVNTRLGFGPISVVGDQVGAFVVGLLTDPIVSDALVDIVDTAFTDFIYSDGVIDALSGAAGDIALAVLTGESVSAATQDALSALRANTDIQAAVRTTVSDALGVINTQVLSNPTFQQDLGTGVTALINELAADQPVQALVTDLYGAPIGELLTNTAVVNDIATAVGTGVTQLLGYSGVSTAVTDAADQFILAVLDGTDAGKAGQEALASLQSDPAFVAAVNAVIPPILDGLLDTAEVREALGVVAQEVTLARLEASWFNIPFLDRIIAQVAKGTVEDFLTRRAGQDLIDTLAVDLLLGMPPSEVNQVVTREIIRDPRLQIALGFSIGQGIGTLFADNIIGDVIGWLAGFPATIVVGIGAAVIGFYQWLVDGWMFLMDALTAPAQPSAVLDLKAGIA